jgi:hypothetical protein
VVRISGIELRRSADQDELSATMGDFPLCYRFPAGAASNATGDAFVAAGLLAAMARGEPLELDDAYTISPAFLRSIDQLQEIFSVWVRDLRHVPVTGRSAPPPAARSGTACFFSGGVDSLYTFLEKESEISHLLHIRGFDYRRDNQSLVEEIDLANVRFAQPRGQRLVVVESNLRELYDSLRVHVFLYHGCHLASIGLAAGFARVYVPSSVTWAELLPWGSHPVTDPLWGTEVTRFVHHGLEADRVQKLRRIVEDPEALALLRVCASDRAYCCGACEKCLRTRVGLRLLGLTSPRLAALDDLGPVRRLRLWSDTDWRVWQDNRELALQAGDRELARAIAVPLARYELRRGLQRMDHLLFGGRLRAAVRSVRGVLNRQPPLPQIRVDR